MTNMMIDPGPGATAPDGSVLRGALLDSRQRWRDLVLLVADVAFETDAWGRFSLLLPDPALGWSAASLLGQPADRLLAHPARAGGINPFRATAEIRHRRAWVKRADGSAACLAFSAAPLRDSQHRIIGTRGIGCDITRQDGFNAQVAAALRRGEVLDHILWRIGHEVLAPRMLAAALDALLHALGAEGAALVALDTETAAPALLHEAGNGAGKVLAQAGALLLNAPQATVLRGSPLGANPSRSDPCRSDPIGANPGGANPGGANPGGANPGGRPLIVAPCLTRFGDHVGLTLWREPGARDWDAEDQYLVGAAVPLIRFALEHAAIQQEMAEQARTDPLTGVLNRRAFLDEISRHVERLDREALTGTLLFIDLDNFKPVNDLLGHETGDRVLACVAKLLRDAVRPTDLVARLGGDEFAVWLDGTDHLSAAERADALCRSAPARLRACADGGATELSLSIGIAARRPGEPLEELMRRADLAMYEVKHDGRGHWRVAPQIDA